MEKYLTRIVIGVEEYKAEEEALEKALKLLEKKGLIEVGEEIMSLKAGVEALKRYAEKVGADELTKIMLVQIFLIENKLRTKMDYFLPKYSEGILTELEEVPDKIFESINKAQLILKNLRREKVKSIVERSPNGIFEELKVVYHGSEREIRTKEGATISIETVLRGEAAYEFLFMLKMQENQRIWLELKYKEYKHGKFLVSLEEYESIRSGTVTEFLRKRLDKNRQQILNNPEELKMYIETGRMIAVEEILEQIKVESEKLDRMLEEFDREEMLYLEKNQELLWL